MPVTTGTGGTGTLWLTETGTDPHGSESQFACAADAGEVAAGADVETDGRADGDPFAAGLPLLLHPATTPTVSTASPTRTRNGVEGRGARMTASDRLQAAGCLKPGGAT